jgi:hypothetical protein
MTRGIPLPSEWSDWIEENQARGVPEIEIGDILAANGFDPRFANAVATNVLSAAPVTQRLNKLEALMSIYSELWAQRGTGAVDRTSEISGATFFRWYYSTNRPLVLLNQMNDWPALERWSPVYLKARCGAAAVEVMMRRSLDPQYEINCDQHRSTIRMDEYVDMVESAGPTNDFYMVANNHSLESSGLWTLLDEIRNFDGILDPGTAPGRVFLWFGPTGTVTPLHHDSMNVLLAQVLGRKLVTLIPSFETHLVYNHLGVYSEVDCEVPDYERYPLFQNVSRLEVLLEPGQALFIPVGWWHHVRSLEVSISVSFTNFLVPNRYAWEGREY